MSDERLRELERRWRETRASDDEAAYLAERVRVGDLSRERVELAALLGVEGAAQVLGGAPRAQGLARLVQTVRLAARLDREGAVRAALGIGHCLLEELRPEPLHEERVEVLRALEGWLDDPSDSRASLARSAAERSSPGVETVRTMRHVANLVAAFTLLGHCPSKDRPGDILEDAVEKASASPFAPTQRLGVAPERLLDALGATLLPWLERSARHRTG